MFKTFSYHIKNRLLMAGAVLLALLSWNFAFRNTADAIILNNELNKKIEQKSDLSVNPDYLKQKHQVLSKVIKQYTLDSAEWRNEFWLKVSRAAASNEVNITYNPSTTRALSDSASQIAKQEIAFKADFKKLVILLDSLEKMKGAGFISSTKFQKEKKINMAESEKLYLRTFFGIVEKEAR